MGKLTVLSLSAAALALVGCGSVKPHIFAQKADVRVLSDGTAALAGASVSVNGRPVGITSKDGRAEVHVQGILGEKFRVAVACPEGFRVAAPEQEILVTPQLRGSPELAFICQPTTRRAVIAIRAENGANLPVQYMGQAIGRTDAAGAATVVLETPPGEIFELVLDTTEAKTLHPQNPTATFTMGVTDDVLVFNQRFTADKPKPVFRAPPPKPKRITPDA